VEIVHALNKHPGAKTKAPRTWCPLSWIAHLALQTLAALTCGYFDTRADDKRASPCTEDVMLVLDASGSMSGNQELGVANSRARIDEVRSALSHVLPTATKNRKVGLITYGPGPYNQCNVKLEFEPMSDSAKKIMRSVDALVPAGKTPLTSAVEHAAEILKYRIKPGVIVVLTDGEETCGGSPCGLGKQLHSLASHLTVHVIAFRYANFSWTGTNTAMDLACLADENRGLYVKANSEQDLIEALRKTLDCPMISHATLE
jgi:Ca-activated chloride channel family protein